MGVKQTEALKLALEALEYISSHYMSLPKIGCMALAAVEEALAEQPAPVAEPHKQQEPVAWVLEWTFNGEERGRRLYDDETHCVFDAENDGGVCRPLVYSDTSPPASKPWVGLKDEEIETIHRSAWIQSTATLSDFARAVEAKLKEKNT